jgi:branched-chain amino acid transport system substrate-binding protein
VRRRPGYKEGPDGDIMCGPKQETKERECNPMSRKIQLAIAVAAAAGFIAAPALADGVKIGMITTLSGGGSSLGIDIRDGFALAIKQGGGQLGGVQVELIVSDDSRKPETAKQIADRMVKSDKVDIMTGIVWSNLAMAVVPGVTRGGTFYISPNAGPSALAGKMCNENYFNVAWQNDNLHEAMGQHVADKGYNNV